MLLQLLRICRPLLASFGTCAPVHSHTRAIKNQVRSYFNNCKASLPLFLPTPPTYALTNSAEWQEARSTQSPAVHIQSPKNNLKRNYETILFIAEAKGVKCIQMYLMLTKQEKELHPEDSKPLPNIMNMRWPAHLQIIHSPFLKFYLKKKRKHGEKGTIVAEKTVEGKWEVEVWAILVFCQV